MRQSLHSEPFPRPLLPCHNNDHYHHCVKRGLSYRYINPGTPLLLWSNFCLICGPVLCMTVSCAVTGDHGSLPSFAGLAESGGPRRRVSPEPRGEIWVRLEFQQQRFVFGGIRWKRSFSASFVWCFNSQLLLHRPPLFFISAVLWNVVID